MRLIALAAGVGVALASAGSLQAAPAVARPSDPGVVNYAVLPKGSVSNIVGASLTWEAEFANPVQTFYVDNPV